jgi:hypothetical protein
MLKIQKLSSPGTSKMLDYVVNVYKDGVFKVAYRYEGWSGTAVEDEVRMLRSRFPDYNGWKIEW